MTFFKTLLTDHKIILAYLSFIAGIGFGIAGLVVPPIGYIHSSVLILIAQLLVLCATLLGLNIKFDLERKLFQTKHNNTSSKEDKETIQKAVDEYLAASNPTEQP